jgi:hypothetical protein
MRPTKQPRWQWVAPDGTKQLCGNCAWCFPQETEPGNLLHQCCAPVPMSIDATDYRDVRLSDDATNCKAWQYDPDIWDGLRALLRERRVS